MRSWNSDVRKSEHLDQLYTVNIPIVHKCYFIRIIVQPFPPQAVSSFLNQQNRGEMVIQASHHFTMQRHQKENQLTVDANTPETKS